MDLTGKFYQAHAVIDPIYNNESLFDYADAAGISIGLEKNSELHCFIYGSDREQLSGFIKIINDFLEGNAIWDISEIDPDHYQKAYYETYNVIETDAFLIRPFFRDHCDSHLKEIVLDPGLNFGTGSHDTTRLMLDMMPLIDFKNKSVLDIGCGSGILTFASSLLGAGCAAGFDTDTNMVYSCAVNSQLNDIGNTFFFNGSIDALESNTLFDIILLNMLPSNFRTLFEKINGHLSKSGFLLLTGILRADRALYRDYVLSYNY
ncbi:MAG: 50S ribosomal protein L11 methyltransferase, partial [candidate division WOR-3 bacterium]|nr:50S ribosomal protein L11 methyltransferase [candidate division WOR-3 bacterium]